MTTLNDAADTGRSTLLLPREGVDELAAAKAAALAVSRGEAVVIPLPVKFLAPSTQVRAPTADSSTCLPEIGAFVRSMGGINSLMIFKDLAAAGYLVRRDGRYASCRKKAGEAVCFISVDVRMGRSEVRVTPAGEALLRELKRAGTLTKSKTPKLLTQSQRDQRAAKRQQEKAARALKKAEDAAALAVSKAEALTKMDQTIQSSIAKRTAARAIWKEAGRAQYRQSQQSNQSSGQAANEGGGNG